MDEIIKESIELEQKYGHLPFPDALPHLQKGWREIAKRYNTTGDKVLSHYMDWRSANQEKK